MDWVVLDLLKKLFQGDCNMNNQTEIKKIEAMITRWKAMARQYYHDKDYDNASQCRQLRLLAIEQINKLKGVS